jgi:hypothetical protein
MARPTGLHVISHRAAQPYHSENVHAARPLELVQDTLLPQLLALRGQLDRLWSSSPSIGSPGSTTRATVPRRPPEQVLKTQHPGPPGAGEDAQTLLVARLNAPSRIRTMASFQEDSP